MGKHDNCSSSSSSSSSSHKHCTKQWTIPLTDNIANPPPCHAQIYLNVEEALNPILPSKKEKITLLGWDSPTVTVTRIGKLVTIILGTGDPVKNLAWTQTSDYSRIPNNVPLVIDFKGTKVEKLIKNGGNHMIVTAPYAFGTSGGPYVSKTGVAQIGPSANPVVKFYPENGPSYSGIAVLDANGDAVVDTLKDLTDYPGNVDIKLTVMPPKIPYGHVYVANINDDNFLIKSVARENDAGVNVSYTVTYGISAWAYKGWPSGNNAIPSTHLTYTLQDCHKYKAKNHSIKNKNN